MGRGKPAAKGRSRTSRAASSSVRDFRRRKTITLFTGQSYLAGARAPELGDRISTFAPLLHLRLRSAGIASARCSLALAAAAGLAASAQAATYTVGTTEDLTGICEVPASGTCSLRQLIAYENSLLETPNPPDTIDVPAPEGVAFYDLSNGPLTIYKSVSIVGAGARAVNIFQESDSETASRVFLVEPDPRNKIVPTVTISGLSMVFGHANASNGYFGGDILNEATLTLNEDDITNGTAEEGSGAGISNDGGTLTVTHSLVANNYSTNQPDGAGGDSGGIQNVGPNPVTEAAGKLTVVDSTIAGNSAALGGGIFSWGDTSNTTSIVNSTIADNDGGTRSSRRRWPAGQRRHDLRRELDRRGQHRRRPAHLRTRTVELRRQRHLLARPQPPERGRLRLRRHGGPQEHRTRVPLGRPAGQRRQHGHASRWKRPVPRSTRSPRAPRAAARPTSGTSRGRRAPAATSAPTSCSSRSRGSSSPRWSAPPHRAKGTTPTIDWGDGTAPSSGKVEANTGQLTGTHTYVNEGIYHASFTYTNSDGFPETRPFDVKVQDAPADRDRGTRERHRGRGRQSQGGDVHPRQPGGRRVGLHRHDHLG